jgi:two-component system, NarL family, response regulator DesR
VVIRVLIAEDMHMIRGALVALLSLERDMEVVAELEGDIDLPGMDGPTAAEQLPECRTLVLTGLSQPGNLLRALKVHVRGFLLKDAPADRPGRGHPPRRRRRTGARPRPRRCRHGDRSSPLTAR